MAAVRALGGLAIELRHERGVECPALGTLPLPVAARDRYRARCAQRPVAETERQVGTTRGGRGRRLRGGDRPGQRDQQLTAVVELQRSDVRRLLLAGRGADPASDVVPDLGAGNQRVTSPRGHAAAQRPDQAAGEQRVTGDRTAVHRALVVERRRDDATASPRTKRIPEVGAVHTLPARPRVAVQRDAAAAGIQDDEDVPCRQARDAAGPGLQV